ncbi:MAG TPA: sulfotransferase, partial [Fimbriimonas sp.]|nr:sulfotransferase [Fimbriimonas sp.]
KAVGAALQQLGRFKEAKSVYLELAHQDPNDARTLFEITQCGPVKADDAVTQLLVSWSPANASHRDRMLIAYARGKADDDLGNFARAKDHFEDANRLADSLIAVPFERAAYKSSIDRTIETFTKEFFRTYVEFGTPFDRPVFIVGMIRSGTTLLERLLAAHPLISPGGEIPFWTEHASKLFDKGRLAGPDESRELVKNYQSILDKVSKSGLVTDKMPLNFSVLGVIHLLLPRAKIIHVVREKRDTMTSIFTTPHPEPINWAHSWERIDFFYRQYERLTRHWHETLDSSIFCEVRYEDLVRQPESVLEILVAFLDLPHDSEIRQEGATKIATPSKWQARQPVHARSIGRWNHYPEWFENL